MKNVFLAAMQALFIATYASVQEPAPTREWVRQYCATAGVSAVSESYKCSYSVTNGFVKLVGSNATESVTIRGEIPDRLALVVSNCTEAAIGSGVTNLMLFAWNGSGSFMNIPAALEISCTSSNMVFNGVSSYPVSGVDLFPGLFYVRGTKVTPSESARLLGEEVVR